MWPYSAFGVLRIERVSKRLTSPSRLFTTSAGTPASRGSDRVDGPVHRVANVVGRRHVDALERLEPLDHPLPQALLARLLRPVGAAGSVGRDDLPDQLLALTDGDGVHEGRQGLGVREGADPAHEHQGVAGPAIRGPRGDTRHAEEAQHVDVVALVRDGEADDVEVPERAQGLEREGLGAGARVLVGVLGIGEEDALADGVRQRVQVLVDRLEAQVGHAHGIGVGIHEGDRDAAAPVLADRTLFTCDEGLGFLLEFPRHATSLSRRVRRERGGRYGRERRRPDARAEAVGQLFARRP